MRDPACQCAIENLLFTEGEKTRKLSEYVPPGLCPVAYNSLAPYLHTISSGGWFNWVTRKAPSFRKSPNQRDFAKRSVNRLYPNEVLVQCPSETGVIFGVGPAPEGKGSDTCVRVLHTKGDCPRNHSVGQVIPIPRETGGLSARDFSALFPYSSATLNNEGSSYKVHVPGSIKKSITVSHHECNGDIIPACPEGDGRQIISTKKIIFPCRYHHKAGEFQYSAMTLDGLCPNAFYSIYPEGLGALYSAKECPPGPCCPEGNVTFEITTKKRYPQLIEKAIDLVNAFMNRLGHPLDLLDREVGIETTSVRGNCPAGHKQGDRFGFNLDDREILCPASFHAIFPTYFSQKQNAMTVSCPDCVGTSYNIGSGQKSCRKP